MIVQYLSIIGSVLGIFAFIITPIILVVRYQDKVDNHEKRLEDIEKKKIPEAQRELKLHLEKDEQDRKILASEIKEFAIKMERLSTLIELMTKKQA